MARQTTPIEPVSRSTYPTARRSVLRAFAGAGLVSTLGVAGVASPVAAAVPGVGVDYKRCHVAFVSNASAIDTIAVYYADRNGDRNARYGIAPTVTAPRGYAPLVVEYDADEDRTQIQLAEPRGALVCVIAEAGDDRTVRTNPTDVCAPAGFNTAPTASFTVSEAPTVGEPVTVTSTATDGDDPERLYYEWDLDGDGTYEATGQQVTTTYSTPGDVTVNHRVTDDCGASDTATRTVTIDSTDLFEQVAKLTADDAQFNDRLGRSVSVDGDTAIVGAPNEAPDGKTSAGSAYVFTRSGGTWSQQQKLTADDAEASDAFGWSVSVDGDTALVGAFSKDLGSEENAGSAYVFTRSGGTWSQQQKLTADDVEVDGFFGWSVSVDGDTALIGAFREDPDGKRDAGSAYVFTRSGGTWSQQQKLTADDAEANDFFGSAVSVDGDTALVGAQREASGGNVNAGSAYVFTRSGGTWSQQQKLTADDAQPFDYFGRSVSVDGDTALIGAESEDPDGKLNAGSAYVFTRSGGTWSQQQKLTADDAQVVDRFGQSVSIDGDTALVGAMFEDPDGKRDAGSAYVFTRSGGTWSQRQKLTADDAQASGLFGVSVSIDEDTALIGANLQDLDGKPNAGSAYVFSK